MISFSHLIEGSLTHSFFSISPSLDVVDHASLGRVCQYVPKRTLKSCSAKPDSRVFFRNMLALAMSATAENEIMRTVSPSVGSFQQVFVFPSLR